MDHKIAACAACPGLACTYHNSQGITDGLDLGPGLYTGIGAFIVDEFNRPQVAQFVAVYLTEYQGRCQYP
jgi:hypothetical protein